MSRLVLITGASGYVGGRLLQSLEGQGVALRCLARRPDFLAGRVGAATEVVEGDVLAPETLGPALEGVDTAYYMIHSMGGAGPEDFDVRDRRGAENFARAARAAGVRRIVYLGGLGDEEVDLSLHLRSRHEVGRILASAGVPVIEFRASIVLGSGSLSFEMLRSLTERLPVMVTPRWVHVRAQPISIGELLAYLVAALDLEADESRVYEIGGAECVSYGDLMSEYARQRRLRRFMIPVPLLTPHLSSLWLGLVTPLYARVGRSLIQSIRHETVVRDDRAARDFAVRPVGVAEAIERALDHEDREFAQTRWSDALSTGGDDLLRSDVGAAVRRGRHLADSRRCEVAVPPERAFAPIRRIGGRRGWYAFNWLWRLRGYIDLLVGGVGLRRGRRDPERVVVGDTLDWWRVEQYEPDRLLRLRAEMRVPGRAWLEFEVEPTERGSAIRQTAIFDPDGLAGLVYWYGIYPLHAAVFHAMLRAIASAAEAAPDDGEPIDLTTPDPGAPRADTMGPSRRSHGGAP